jgi:sialic acid synthase SpsE
MSRSKTYIIAEIGINHQGDINIAKKLIDMSNFAGCDAVKFQKRTPSICVPRGEWDKERDTPWGKMRYIDYKERMEFWEEQYDEIDWYCEKLGIDWGMSVWDMPSLNFAKRYDPPFIKLPSAMLENEELLIGIAKSQTARPIISTGMSTDEEIERAIKIMWLSNRDVDPVIMHCNSSYPCAVDELNLLCIPQLIEDYGLEIGYCVAPVTRILTTDLRWISAGELRVGDKIVAFDEELGLRTKMKPAIVINNCIRELPCYRIITDRGDIVVSDKHRLVTNILSHKKRSGDNVYRAVWMEAQYIKPGMRIRHFVEPWSTDTSYEGGWLSGIFDGEGWVSGHRVAVAQNPGMVLDKIEEVLTKKGYLFSGRRQRKDRECVAIEIGGRRNALRLLGSVRPIRLLEKSHKIWHNVRAYSHDSKAEVLSVEPIGIQTTCAITTSTGTLITEGFFSHNSGHEFGLVTTFAAVALGATFVERHVTLDRTMWGTDHMASVEPTGVIKLVKGIRDIEKALGDGRKRVYRSELPSREKLRGPIPQDIIDLISKIEKHDSDSLLL